jgi:hypothetical protein
LDVLELFADVRKPFGNVRNPLLNLRNALHFLLLDLLYEPQATQGGHRGPPLHPAGKYLL